MEEWNIALSEMVHKFENSELIDQYKKKLKAVKLDSKSSNLLNSYRKIGKYIKSKEDAKEEVEEIYIKEFERIAKSFEESKVLKNFLEYDYQVYQLLESIDLELRKKIKEIFLLNYGDNEEG